MLAVQFDLCKGIRNREMILVFSVVNMMFFLLNGLDLSVRKKENKRVVKKIHNKEKEKEERVNK